MKKVAFVTVLTLNLLLVSIQSNNAQSNAISKKVDLIIKLAKFIDWTGENEVLNSTQLLYIITDNNLVINYEINSNRNTNYQKWQVVFTQKVIDFEDGSVVYVTKQKPCEAGELIKYAADKNILTISEQNNNFCSEGGMINITPENNGHKFEINYKIIQQKSLNISSKVLALAKIYDE